MLSNRTVASGTYRALVSMVLDVPSSAIIRNLTVPSPLHAADAVIPCSLVLPALASNEMKSSLNGVIVIDAPVSKMMGYSPHCVEYADWNRTNLVSGIWERVVRSMVGDDDVLAVNIKSVC